MKDVVKVKKEEGKLFTRKESNSTIIKENYNPLEVNSEIYKRRDGLCMKNDLELNDLLNNLNFIERMFFKRKFIEVYKQGLRQGFKWSNSNVR